MKKITYLFIIIFSLLTNITFAQNIMILKLKYGEVEIELYPGKALNHVKRFIELSDSGKYDGVVFHRVIDGFMAQTGDVKFEIQIVRTLIIFSRYRRIRTSKS